ncbi:hypothetical protein [Vibrio vulnificus]|uniref:hypothetical protein n=1 Tax=Vibrio vulnificus TaxID=672 RepID=UPI001023111F|nr:hypothetical protein [Vibrio vulnificus]EHZ2651910.1 hypothetical protein [Vibrio vulnificus]MCU8194296.1 hypothetical protein [Vibrio vulnificus]RZQ33236.1 hypothetical protein D8T38_18510 [Vibrio vulnificus]HAS6231036.1 hypothetical protein [Vibrio vulnificus]HDY7776792.1 hypothetical protein [Vibrio vulnificus]
MSTEQSVNSQVLYNQAYVARAVSEGRREIRGRLSDKQTSALYDEMAQDIPKKKLGHLLTAMVQLAHMAKEEGVLVIDENGNVSLNSDKLNRRD